MMVTDSVSDTPRYRFEWTQDAKRRLMRLAGDIDATAASHVANGLIDLGNRRLVIDLTEVESICPEAVAVLTDMGRRLGAGRVTIELGHGEPLSIDITEPTLRVTYRRSSIRSG